jgi:lipopolysaccharide transport system permease protein
MSNHVELIASEESERGDRRVDRVRDAAELRSPHASRTASEETVIAAGKSGKRYLRDLWRYRELFLFLAWRDLLVRYKQTVVGVTWSLIRPILTMLVLTVVFGKLGKMPSGGVPYPLLVFCGVLPWQFFATALSESGHSLVANTGLISKVYFPRLLIPAGTLATALVDMLISLAFLGALMIWYGWVPPATAAFLPLFLLLASVASFGVGVWIAALMVQYRDFRFIVPFVVQFGLYISPVGFVSSVVPEQYRLLYDLNPMVGVIDGFRWCILGGEHALDGLTVAVSAAVSGMLLVTGIRHFRRTERTFADVI